MDSHLGIEKPQRILFFPWLIHRLDFTFLWQIKPILVQNIPRRLLECDQALIWKPLRPTSAVRTRNQMVLFNSLGSTSYWNATLKYWDKLKWPDHSCLKVFRAFQNTTIDQVCQLPETLCGILSNKAGMGRCSAHFGCEQDFLNGHIFDQAVLHAVTYDSNNNLILLTNAVVTSETKDYWVWFRFQLDQDFPGLYVVFADYTEGIESHQFQGDISHSGCLFAQCFKHLSKNAKKAMPGIKR